MYWTNAKWRRRDKTPADSERRILTQFGTKFETSKISPALILARNSTRGAVQNQKMIKVLDSGS